MPCPKTRKKCTFTCFSMQAANNSLSQDYPHLDNHTKQITDTPEFKPFTKCKVELMLQVHEYIDLLFSFDIVFYRYNMATWYKPHGLSIKGLNVDPPNQLIAKNTKALSLVKCQLNGYIWCRPRGLWC